MRGRQAEKTQPEITGEAYLITQVKQEVCSPDQPEAHSLSEGSGCDPALAHGHLLGCGEQEGASSGCRSSGCPSSGCLSSGVGEREGASGCLSAGSSADPLVLPRLCCALCALPPGGLFPALHCPPPTFSLSWILSAATGQAGDTGITRPSSQPGSCPRPALLL